VNTLKPRLRVLHDESIALGPGKQNKLLLRFQAMF